jgi:hypothetical protein
VRGRKDAIVAAATAHLDSSDVVTISQAERIFGFSEKTLSSRVHRLAARAPAPVGEVSLGRGLPARAFRLAELARFVVDSYAAAA